MIRPLLLCLLFAPSLCPNAAADVARLYGRGEYRKCVEALTSENEPLRDEAERRLWLARCYMKLRRWDDAVGEMEQAVAADQSNCVLHLWLARAYGRKASHAFFVTAIGLAKKVRAEFELARSLCPANTDVRFDLLTFYLEAPGFLGGGRDKAEAEAREIARLDPRLGRTARASIAEKDKDWERALGEFRKATEDFPTAPEAHYDLAEHLFRRGDFPGAATSARRALELRSPYPGAELVLARSRIEMGEDVAGAVNLLKALSSGPLMDGDPSFQEVYYWLGKGYVTLRMKPEAIRALESALRFDPGHAGAKSALARARELP